MRTMLFAALFTAFALGAVATPAFAQESCKSKALGKMVSRSLERH